MDAGELTALRAEVERLRRLVGPSERAYDELREDLLAAREAAKQAEAAAGEVRGELAEVYVALDRARQIEAVMQRTIVGRLYRGTARLRRAAGRARRAVRGRLA